MGLNSEPSSSEQDDLLGLLESISSNSAISGEAPTLGNELSMLARGVQEACRNACKPRWEIQTVVLQLQAV